MLKPIDLGKTPESFPRLTKLMSSEVILANVKPTSSGANLVVANQEFPLSRAQVAQLKDANPVWVKQERGRLLAYTEPQAKQLETQLTRLSQWTAKLTPEQLQNLIKAVILNQGGSVEGRVQQGSRGPELRLQQQSFPLPVKVKSGDASLKTSINSPDIKLAIQGQKDIPLPKAWVVQQLLQLTSGKLSLAPQNTALQLDDKPIPTPQQPQLPKLPLALKQAPPLAPPTDGTLKIDLSKLALSDLVKPSLLLVTPKAPQNTQTTLSQAASEATPNVKSQLVAKVEKALIDSGLSQTKIQSLTREIVTLRAQANPSPAGEVERVSAKTPNAELKQVLQKVLAQIPNANSSNLSSSLPGLILPQLHPGTTGGGFFDQLADALQLLLTSRQPQANAPAKTSVLSQFFNNVIKTPLSTKTEGKNTKDSTVKGLNKLATRELPLQQLGDLFNLKEVSRLQTAEQHTQGQNGIFFVIPGLLDGKQLEHQVLLKVIEEEENDGNKTGKKKTRWQLTMRLDLKEMGALLVKMTLNQEQTWLNFYTDSTTLCDKVRASAHQLEERLKGMDIEIKQLSVSQGKIPESLMSLPPSILNVEI